MKTKHYLLNNGLASTRQRLGLTQTELARELGISRSLLNMAERGERSLASPPLIKLAALEISLSALDTAEQPQRPHQAEAFTDYDNDMLEAHQDKELNCRYRSNVAAYKLDRMEEEYEECRKCLELYEKMVAFNHPLSQEASFKSRHYNIMARLKKCGLHAQTLLRNKIALLNAEAELNRSVQQRFQP